MFYRIVVLVCALFACVCATCGSACAAEPPELEEWYWLSVANNPELAFVAGPVAHIPNFGVGGTRATVVGVSRRNENISGNPVWYNRYKYDTVSQYRWLGGRRFNILQVDLDNNGVLDYLADGYLIRGIKDGEFPEQDTLRRYPYFFSLLSNAYNRVDLNGDGYDDVLCNLNGDEGRTLLSVLVGGSDLKNLKYTLYNRRGGEYLIGLMKHKGNNGAFRVVTMPYDTYKVDGYVYMKWTSLVLSELTTEMLGDSLHISLQTLDSTSLNTIETGYQYGYLQSGVYYNSYDDREYLLITEYYQRNNGRVQAFDVQNDKFTYVMGTQANNRSLYTLGADINGDGYEDWAVRSGDWFYFYAGQREGLDSVPFGRYRLRCTDQIATLRVIGDVDGDGVGDMAYALQPNAGVNGCFGIILGASRRTVGVAEPVAGYTRSYDMQQSYPNPATGTRSITVPVSVEKLQRLSLEVWTLDGRLLERLYEGVLPAGMHELAVSLPRGMATGMYVLRLVGAEGTRSRAFVVE